MSIPKKIHYCWLSGDPYPEDVKKCIDSWTRIMPDYDIKLWDAHNFDCDILPYTSEAWSKNKYAFVSDIVRLYALYTEGGIYLDSDVEALRRFDDLLDNPAFTGFESGNRIGPWLIAGEKGNLLIKELLDYYKGRHFCDEIGRLDLTPNTVPVTKILSNYGLKPENSLQKLSNITIYPEEYFCPKNPWTNKINITENSYAMHYFAGAWNDKSEEEKRFVGNVDVYIKSFIKWIKSKSLESEIIIFGTGVVGMRTFECLCTEQMRECVCTFMVTKRDNAWKEIDRVTIKEVKDVTESDLEKVVLVATNPKTHEEIGRTLIEKGFENIYFLGAH